MALDQYALLKAKAAYYTADTLKSLQLASDKRTKSLSDPIAAAIEMYLSEIK